MARRMRSTHPTHIVFPLVVALATFMAVILSLAPGLQPTSTATFLGAPEQLDIAPVLAASDRIAGPRRVHPGRDYQQNEFYIHVPPGAMEPLTVVVALPGMGGVGEDFSRTLKERTDPQDWVLVAPTFNYGDWTDPNQLTREAATHHPRLIALLDRLPEITGLSVRPQILLYGYSRGAQAANRFALAYPNRVAGVAMVSAGTYTIPQATFSSTDGSRALPFPYGVSNMQELFGQPFEPEAFARIPFWIAVGARDNDPTEVPQQWTPYVGGSRLERAQRFGGWLQTAGCNVQVHIFEGVGHGETEAVRTEALEFLASIPQG